MNNKTTRWFLMLLSIIMNACIGSVYAWSVFQKPLIQLFNWTPAQASLAFSLIMGISAIPMAFTGKAQEYVQPRTVILIGGLFFGLGIFFTGYIKSIYQLYLVYGLLAGVGVGVVYSGIVANMVRFFPDKRGLCSGMLAGGMALGGLIFAPIANSLIVSYGVLNTFKILGLIYTITICSLSSFIKTAPVDYKPEGWSPMNESKKSYSGIEKNWRQMLQDPLFFLIAAMFITGTSSGLMVYGHASPILQEILMLTPQEAAVIVGIISLANAMGRIFWGIISDIIGRFPTFLTMYCISGVSMLGLSVVSGRMFFIIIMILIGSCYGGYMAMIASVTADNFGMKHLPINFGVMFLSYGIAAYNGPRIAAVVKMANNGSYSQAFLIAAGLSLIGIVFTLIAIFLRKRRSEYIDQMN